MVDNRDIAREGIRLGNYRIRDQIGRGGMGTVYRAEHTTLGTEVAVKVLSPRFATDPAFIARFEREARAAAALSHPNIVRVFDAGDDNGLRYIIMEYVSGQTLADVLAAQGKLDVPHALQILKDITSALVHAHARGIIHRDITPGNIMITPDGQVKLTDMGLAKQVGSQLATGATETGATVGTPYYMSPEQVVDSKSVDPRTDLYSLGATMYHLVTGKRPFDGGSAYEIMRRVETEDPVGLHRLEPSVRRDVCRLVERLMAKSRRDRYQSAEELVEDIERIEAGDHIARHRTRLKAFRPAGSARKHWKIIVIAGSSAAVVAAAVIIGFLLSYRPQPVIGETPVAIAVTGHPPPPVNSGDRPSLSITAPWPMVLPSAPVDIETTGEGYVFSAGTSRLTVSPEQINLALMGRPVLKNEFLIYREEAGKLEATSNMVLEETPEGAILLRKTYAFPPLGPDRFIRQRVRFSERAALIEWEAVLPPHDDVVHVGLDFEGGFLGADDAPGQGMIGLFMGDTLGAPSGIDRHAVTVGGGAGWSIEQREKGDLRLVRRIDALNAGTEHVTMWVLLTAVPRIERELYAAALANGGLTLFAGEDELLVGDRFFQTGFDADAMVPTGYYFDEQDLAIGYRFAVPPSRPEEPSPLVKSLLFTEARVQMEWLWHATEASQIAFQVAPATVLGRNFIAKLADGKSESGVLSSTTNLENVRALVVDLGDRTVSFTGKGADYAFDGEHVRLVHTGAVEPGEPRTGKLVIEFAKPPASE